MPNTSDRSKDYFLAKRVARACVTTAVFTCLAFQSDSTARAQDTPAVTRIVASEDNTTPTSIPQKREAWMDASDYSVAHPNVASFVVNGHAQNATNQQIVNYIQTRFANHGITNSIAFSGRPESLGVSMSFFLNGHAYGPIGFANMNATIDEVAGHVRGLQAD